MVFRADPDTRLTGVVDLAAAGINGFEKLVYFLVGHLLSEVCEDYYSDRVSIQVLFPYLSMFATYLYVL